MSPPRWHDPRLFASTGSACGVGPGLRVKRDNVVRRSMQHDGLQVAIQDGPGESVRGVHHGLAIHLARMEARARSPARCRRAIRRRRTGRRETRTI